MRLNSYPPPFLCAVLNMVSWAVALLLSTLILAACVVVTLVAFAVLLPLALLRSAIRCADDVIHAAWFSARVAGHTPKFVLDKLGGGIREWCGEDDGEVDEADGGDGLGENGCESSADGDGPVACGDREGSPDDELPEGVAGDRDGSDDSPVAGDALQPTNQFAPADSAAVKTAVPAERAHAPTVPEQDSAPGPGDAGVDRKAEEVPWSYFWGRVQRTRAAQFRSIQSDATGVMRAVHDLLHAALPALPSDEEISKAFALAWNDVVTRVAAGEEPPGLGGKTREENIRRLAWRRAEAYAPRRTVYVGSPADEHGRRWYTVQRLFTGEATVFLSDERETVGGGVSDRLTVFAFASYDGTVAARVKVPHPLAGCPVAIEPPDGYEERACPGSGRRVRDVLTHDSLGVEPVDAETFGDEPLVMRVPVNRNQLVTGEPARRFLLEHGAMIVEDLERALADDSWRTPDGSDDEDGMEW